jgi:hypothetical protein
MTGRLDAITGICAVRHGAVEMRQDRRVREPDRWWVFDRPLLRDPLLVLGLVVGLGGCVALFLTDSHPLNVLAAWPSGLLVVGILGGSFREYKRSRR